MRTPQPETKEDFIQPVPEGVEAWSENIFFFPFDYGKKVGIFSHLGRSFHDLVQGLTGLREQHNCILTPSFLTCNREQGTGHLELSRFNQTVLGRGNAHA